MPFSLSVIKGEAELSECPYLAPEVIHQLQGLITKSDWREDLIQKMKDEIAHIRFSEIAEGIGAGLQDGSLVINCMGREFIVYPDGRIETHGHITPWIKILLLHYIRTRGSHRLSGTWVSYSDLKSGMIKASSFQRECEVPLCALLDARLSDVTALLKRFGAEQQDGFPTANAWRLNLLPMVPVIILYWPAEEEFPSKVRILFDATADKFLDVESLIFLVEGLVKNIEIFLSRKP